MSSTELEWMERAACKNYPTAWWFPHPTQHGAEAKAICAGCPVKSECLQLALEDGQLFGIWGQTSERQRRSMRQKVS